MNETNDVTELSKQYTNSVVSYGDEILSRNAVDPSTNNTLRERIRPYPTAHLRQACLVKPRIFTDIDTGNYPPRRQLLRWIELSNLTGCDQ